MHKTSPAQETPVTVLLPVHNAEHWIGAATASLAKQTYSNFEVLLINDRTTDQSIAIAKEVAGSRLRVVDSNGPGVAAALATGVQRAETEFLIRMDADDIAHPRRIEKQVNFLTTHPDHVVVGTAAHLMNSQGRLGRTIRHPTLHEAITLRMCLATPFIHPSVALRKSAVVEAGNYSAPGPSPYPEDFSLWSRLQWIGKLANLPDVLMGYRSTPGGVSSSSWKDLASHTGEIAARNLSQRLGSPEPTVEMVRLLSLYHDRTSRISLREVILLETWLLSAQLRVGLNPSRWGIPLSAFLRPVRWTTQPPQLNR